MNPLDGDCDPSIVREPNGLNSAGAMLGDIGIPDTTDYLAPTWLSNEDDNKPAVANENFHAVLTGPWTPQGLSFFWHSNAPGAGSYGDTIYNLLGWGDTAVRDYPETFLGALVSPNGKVVNGYDTDTPYPVHIHLSVTDGLGSDGATATANYYMNVHRGVEESHSARTTNLGTVYYNPIGFTVLGTNYAPYTSGVWVDYSFEDISPLWGQADGTLSVGSTLPYPISTVAESLDLAVKHYTPVQYPQQQNYDSVWTGKYPGMSPGTFWTSTWEYPSGSGHAFTQSSTPPAAAPTIGWQMKITHVLGAWTLSSWNLVDTYDTNGFEGEQKVELGPFDGIGGAVGDFALIGHRPYKW